MPLNLSLWIDLVLSCGCTVRRLRYWLHIGPYVGETVHCYHHDQDVRVVSSSPPYNDE